MQLYKSLTPEEEARFRQWARENYQTYEPILGVWHPAVQDECVKMNTETGFSGIPGAHAPDDDDSDGGE
jgi:alpha-ketoglutarate-dependent taurine dioxygenase